MHHNNAYDMIHWTRCIGVGMIYHSWMIQQNLVKMLIWYGTEGSSQRDETEGGAEMEKLGEN